MASFFWQFLNSCIIGLGRLLNIFQKQRTVQGMQSYHQQRFIHDSVVLQTVHQDVTAIRHEYVAVGKLEQMPEHIYLEVFLMTDP